MPKRHGPGSAHLLRGNPNSQFRKDWRRDNRSRDERHRFADREGADRDDWEIAESERRYRQMRKRFDHRKDPNSDRALKERDHAFNASYLAGRVRNDATVSDSVPDSFADWCNVVSHAITSGRKRLDEYAGHSLGPRLAAVCDAINAMPDDPDFSLHLADRAGYADDAINVVLSFASRKDEFLQLHRRAAHDSKFAQAWRDDASAMCDGWYELLIAPDGANESESFAIANEEIDNLRSILSDAADRLAALEAFA